MDLNGNSRRVFQYKFWAKLVICKSRVLQPFADTYIIADLGGDYFFLLNHQANHMSTLIAFYKYFYQEQKDTFINNYFKRNSERLSLDIKKNFFFKQTNKKKGLVLIFRLTITELEDKV